MYYICFNIIVKWTVKITSRPNEDVVDRGKSLIIWEVKEEYGFKVLRAGTLWLTFLIQKYLKAKCNAEHSGWHLFTQREHLLEQIYWY